MARPRLTIVTATTNPQRAEACLATWGDWPLVIVVNGQPWTPQDAETTTCQARWIVSTPYLGTVGAFKLGTDFVLEHWPGAEIIACLHDDLAIHDPSWGDKMLRHFDRQPACGLAGFGGAIGLGSDDLYTSPYDPMHLARRGFRSNMTNAEQHGARSLLTERVACLDGFSQLGRREFWAGYHGDFRDFQPVTERIVPYKWLSDSPPWTVLADLGIHHHFYDGMLGCLAARYGWETWYLPIACTHHGGRTAVGDAGYQDWAKTQCEGGDHGFWERAHRVGYDHFRDVLPLRV